jgi:hypothetical protein
MLGSLAMVCGKIGLKIGAFVPVQAQPLQAVDDAFNGFLGGPFHVGIFNPKDELALILSGPEPVQEGGTGTANVEIAGGAGGKTDTHFRHDTCSSLGYLMLRLEAIKRQQKHYKHYILVPINRNQNPQSLPSIILFPSFSCFYIQSRVFKGK